MKQVALAGIVALMAIAACSEQSGSIYTANSAAALEAQVRVETPRVPGDSGNATVEAAPAPPAPAPTSVPAVVETAAQPVAPQPTGDVPAITLTIVASTPGDKPVHGWLQWRGPQQNGTSLETNLPEKWDGAIWELDLRGRGTPVIADGRVYAWGYQGDGPDLQEVLICLDEKTGQPLWEHRFNDFLSDVVYDRYSIGSPTVDADTGNVYLLTTAGDFVCYSRDGKLLWSHAMAEDLGRLTFPNGRTGAPAIDGDLVIIHCISANWGKEGPPLDRLYAFDKRSGQIVWSSSPGLGPPYLKDSSFGVPLFDWHDGKRVFYVGTGCGNVVCINALTGEPLWRYQFAIGGVNSSVLLHEDKVIAIHGVENVDSSVTGRMMALDRTAKPGAPSEPGGTPVMDKSAEKWRIDGLSMFTSSPVLAEGRVYQVSQTGELVCAEATTGRQLWEKKLGNGQIHASPLWADGKLYVPMEDGNFWVLRPSDSGAEVLSQTKLEGNCLGSPAVWNGKIYVHTTERLYCFGKADNAANLPKPVARAQGPAPGEAKSLQIVPSEVVLKPGEKATFHAYAIDAAGLRVGEVDVTKLKWVKFIPPTAKVKSEMDGQFNEAGELVVAADAKESAGSFRATYGPLSGTIRGRVLEKLPFREDFEGFELTEDHTADNVKFAYPPLPWIGARFKWEVRDLEGNKVLAKTLDRLILQRAQTFVGPADMSNYTMQADVMTDGNRRLKSEVGLIHQRYVIELKGNHNELEVNSNHERVKVAVPFTVDANVWYTMKSRVDVAADGSGVVRAKAWKKGEPEPEQWTIEVPHKNAHRHGAPGVFGFSPQSKFRVYVDNISITPN